MYEDIIIFIRLLKLENELGKTNNNNKILMSNLQGMFPFCAS